MLKPYEAKLQSIKDEISKIGVDVINSLELSLRALEDRKIDDLKNVDLTEKKLLLRSNEIDNIIVTTLALYSPEAKDLRQLVSYLKITNELVRTGSNAKDFAKMFKKSYSDDLNTNMILEYAVPLLKSALLSLQTSISILDETNANHIEEKYHRVIVEESKTDDLYLMIEKNILKLISKNLDLSKEYFDILSALRRLEKIADRAVSIANLLHFAQVGGDMVQSWYLCYNFCMKKAINKIKNYFSTNFEVLAGIIIFIGIIASGKDFYKAIIFILEFIVIMEVVKMVSDFIKKETLRLRYVIDIFIIFLIRDVIILTTNKNRDYFDISFLLFVIFVFFIFRILAIKFSPGVIKISKDTVIEYDDERPNKKVTTTKESNSDE